MTIHKHCILPVRIRVRHLQRKGEVFVSQTPWSLTVRSLLSPRGKRLLDIQRMMVPFSCVLLVLLPLVSVAGAQVIHSFTEPEETIEVAFAQPGIIDSINVVQGDVVRAGDQLAALNTDVLLASQGLAQARAESVAQLEAAQVEVKLKESQREKLMLVQKSGHASSLEIERAQAELEAAHAQLKMAQEKQREQTLELQEIIAQIKQRQLHSPTDGVVVRVHKKRGEFISSSEPTMITLVKLEKLRVRFYISSEQAVSLEKHKRVSVLLNQEQLSAEVDFISPITEADSGTVRLEVLLDNQQAELRSGVPCQLMTDQAKASSTLVISSQ